MRKKWIKRGARVLTTWLLAAGMIACTSNVISQSTNSTQNQEEITSLAHSDKVVIHYHRFDGNYEQAALWTWDGRGDKDPDNQEIFFSGETEFGVYFVVDPSIYGEDDSDAERIGFVARLYRDWNHKDGSDRSWTPSMGHEIWLIGNDPKIYTEKPDISPRIAFAHIDDSTLLTLKLSHPINAQDVHTVRFIVKHDGKQIVPLKDARPINVHDGETHFVEIETEFPIDFLHSTYEVSTLGYRAAEAVVGDVMFNKDLFYTDEPLGAVYTPESTTFRLFSPLAESLSVVLYDNAVGEAGRNVVPMANVGKGVWEVKVDGDLLGRHYRILTKNKKYGEMEVIDPYATNTTGDDGNPRITDLRAEDPEGFRPIVRPEYGKSWTDAVIWEIHIRDFSIDPSSGAPEDLRGKYGAFTLKGTHHPEEDSITTMVEHIKELGITHVQILPPQDFDNDEENTVFNWGYMTAFFDSPEGWYSSNHRTEARIREFKELVKALKDAGIGVIMDVVYNHTGTQNTFDQISPNYFLRTKDDGSFWNGSGTGNEFHSESPMGRQFIINSCKFWVEEYGIDGFRFDLMGLIDIQTMKELKEELVAIYPEVMVYGEPWAATGPDGTGIDRITYKDVVRGSGIGAFNDHFRNALKGSPDGGEAGYVQNASGRDGIIRGIAGSIDDWASEPWESINYATCHDNLVLWDKFQISAPGLSDDDYRKMQKLTGGILAVSQGILFYHAGSEFCRTKQGEHNSYSSDDSINKLDWNLKREYDDVFQFHKGVIAIRRAHPVFRLPEAQEIRNRIKFHNGLPAPETIAFSLNGANIEGESWKDVIVLINPKATDLEFNIPAEGSFDAYIHAGKASTPPLAKGLSGRIVVPARSMTLLAR